jgi:DNA-binding NtrC family response regulator
MVERFEGNKSAAAEVLGISRTRLYRLLEGDAEV